MCKYLCQRVIRMMCGMEMKVEKNKWKMGV